MLQIWNRSSIGSAYNLYQNVTVPRPIKGVAIDANATEIAASTSDLIYVYRNISGVYRLVDMFAHSLPYSSDCLIKALPDF